MIAPASGVSASIDVLLPEVDEGLPDCSDAWPWRLPTGIASRAIHTESEALAALGP